MGGIPRANYMPYPFQIVQSPQGIFFVYGFASANRLVNMGKPIVAGSDTWMGTNNGHWENETLVVDVTGLNGLAWFDRSGNWADDNLHVVERFTLVSHEVLNYEATVEDPSVFAKSWKIGMPLYRRAEKNAEVLDFKCVEFAEKLMYGRYTQPPAAPSITGVIDMLSSASMRLLRIVLILAGVSNQIMFAQSAQAPAVHPDFTGYYRGTSTPPYIPLNNGEPTVPTRITSVVVPRLQPWAKLKMEATNGTADDPGMICQPDGFWRYTFYWK